MGIYIWRDHQEFGPYRKDEVFAFLKDGSLDEGDSARTVNSEQWKPVKDVLREAESGLFSVEEIVRQAPRECAEAILPLAPARSKTVAEPTAEGWPIWKWAALTACGLGLVAALRTGFFPSTPPPIEAMESSVAPDSGDLKSRSTPSVAIRETEPEELVTPGPRTLAQMPEPEPKGTPLPEKVKEALEVAKFPAPAPAPRDPPPAAVASEALPSPPASPKVAEAARRALPARMIRLRTSSESIDRAELWVVDTTEKPRAILLLCFDGRTKVEREIRKAEWQNFARTEQCLLVVARFSSPPKFWKSGDDYTKANQGSGRLLLNGLRLLTGGKDLPVVAYGRESGGSFVASLANFQPESFKGWAAFTNVWPQPKADKYAPPGLVAADQEYVNKDGTIRGSFEKGRALAKPWAFLKVAGEVSERPGKVEEFARSYLGAILGGSPKEPACWVGIDTRHPLSALDKMAATHKAMWLPDASLLEGWAALMPSEEEGQAPVVIQKKVATRSAQQPEINFFLRLPPSAADEKPKINGTLAFCTWEKDPEAIIKSLEYRPDGKAIKQLSGPASLVAQLIRYAEQNHLALVTWDTRQIWKKTLGEDELRRTEELAFDREFNLLSEAWERGMELFHRDNDIPTTELLLYGISRGAQWAHRLALRKPERFLAVHMHIPSSFDTPVPEANRVLWLVTTGDHEVGYPKAIQFYKEARDLGYPMIFKAIMGLGHRESKIADDLGFRFFDYALALRESRERALLLQQRALSALGKGVQENWLEGFRQPIFVGDFLNQDVFPGSQSELIPAGLRVPLPTKELASAWTSGQ